ncbi:hypothetical protein EON62_02775, partial [archaeon]
ELDADERVTSSVLTDGVLREYTASTLRGELRVELRKVGNEIALNAHAMDASSLRLTNLETALADTLRHLDIESTGLARTVFNREHLRLVALNTQNVRVNDVLGMALGGSSHVVSAVDTNVFSFALRNGSCVQAFSSSAGDGEGSRNKLGHSSTITAITACSSIIYTGSANGTVCAWDASTTRRYDGRQPHESPLDWEPRDPAIVADLESDDEAVRLRVLFKNAGLLHVMEGHSAGVVALAATPSYLLSGGADRLAILWQPQTGELIRKLKAHDSSVACIHADEESAVTSGPDRSVCLWSFTFSVDGEVETVTQKARLEGHNDTVTAVYCEGLKVMSGSADGDIIQWDTVKKIPVRRFRVHKPGSTIYQLQFDSLKIVSFASDMRLVVTDLVSGIVSQDTYEPHGAQRIMDMQFDNDTLITVAEDRSLLVWAWRDGRFADKPREVADRPLEHMVAADESFLSIAGKYHLDMKDLLFWNNMDDPRRIYKGMCISLYPPEELSVPRRGTEPARTEAEIEAERRIKVATATAVETSSMAGRRWSSGGDSASVASPATRRSSLAGSSVGERGDALYESDDHGSAGASSRRTPRVRDTAASYTGHAARGSGAEYDVDAESESDRESAALHSDLDTES